MGCREQAQKVNEVAQVLKSFHFYLLAFTANPLLHVHSNKQNHLLCYCTMVCLLSYTEMEHEGYELFDLQLY